MSLICFCKKPYIYCINVLIFIFSVKAGWGDWAGPGGMEVSKKILDKRNKLMMQVQKENEIKRLDRKDAKNSNVMISERRIADAAKYKINEVPYPFKSREEYERSLQLPLGGMVILVINIELPFSPLMYLFFICFTEEWNASQAVNALTQADVKKRSGRIIEPIKLPKRQASANATASNSSVKKKQKTTK